VPAPCRLKERNMSKTSTQTATKSAASQPKAKSATARRKRAAPAPAPTSKLDQIEAALRTRHGATITDLMKLTGWQMHSVRGALAGALKKTRGLAIISTKVDGVRTYKIKA
jgi:hypothetical protein